MIALEIGFWIGIAILFYTYIGYPLLLIALNKIFSARTSLKIDKGEELPTVSFLIAAYNEEKVIHDKIINCLSLDYPSELLTVWIASDGSSDKTNEIVKTLSKNDKRVQLLEFPRTGKSGVLNKAIPYIKSEIVLFSDANTQYAKDALKKLVKHFTDPKVGCVCGRLIYRNPGKVLSGTGESFYWRYETFLKKMESKLGYVAGANGAIYAIRKELFEPLPPKTINDDFMVSMRIVRKGFKSIFEENAIAYEDVAPTMEGEFKRHVRDGAGHYIAVYHLLSLLNPFLGIKSFIYWSHRILRWAAPFLLMIVFIMNSMLVRSGFYKTIFIFHVCFYAMAVIGLVSIRRRQLPFLMYVPFYFCNLNLALLYGFSRAITGRQKMTWERTERAG